MLVPLDRVEEFAGGVDHSEGICLAPDGTIYASGEDGQLYRLSDGTAEELLRTGGMALGLAATAEGEILMCSASRSAVLRIDPVSRTWTTYSTGTAETPMRQPNWGCFDAAGNYYVSDSGGWDADDGLVYRISPDGVTEVWTRECSGFPNGTCISADGGELLVLESTTPALVAVPIRADGSAGARRVIAILDGTVPDGVAVSDDGRFVVACYRPDTVLLVQANGEVEVLVTDPRGTVIAAPTNVVFVGDDLSEMVVPNLGRWHISKFSHPGLRGVPLHYPSLAEAEQESGKS
jgi:gluconolactonase